MTGMSQADAVLKRMFPGGSMFTTSGRIYAGVLFSIDI
uniref:Uncharacterized protein n=1 Tax=uncultured prokaryote TaxID=198431 RepID=A0A0H5Q221_9ZZZZ|nr:hypothetical protein [uncultured prokaryote]